MLTQQLLDKAHKVFIKHFAATVTFQRAIFLNWYCPLDCKFCFMSVEKSNIIDPKKARRTPASLLTEAYLCRKLGWEIEFLSSGYRTLEKDYLLKLLKNLYIVTGNKQWLNVGVLTKEELEYFQDYIIGSCGAVETVNPVIHKRVCPSKPVEPIVNMFKACDERGLKKAMTLIIGIGETIEDFKLLKDFISQNKIDRITVYSLNPINGTIFTLPPARDYYLEWLAKIRIAFPNLEIIVGVRDSRLDTISQAMYLGVNSLTKFAALKHFNSKYSQFIEQEIKKSGRILHGTLTELPEIDINEIDEFDLDSILKIKLKAKIESYIKMMKRGKKEVIIS